MTSAERAGGDPTIRQLTGLLSALFALTLAPASLAAGVAFGSWWAGHGLHLPPLSLDWVQRAFTGKPVSDWFTGHHPPVPAPSSRALVFTVAVLTYLLVAVLIVALVRWAGAASQGQDGMATRAQVEQSLGAGALTHRQLVRTEGRLLPTRRGSKAEELRPDLYGPGRVR